uniref:Uncharacterized protein n=1 Tax=Anguilla anguilla TaxID=7936 RepID=A0A0E9PAH3_ANGAN
MFKSDFVCYGRVVFSEYSLYSRLIY